MSDKRKLTPFLAHEMLFDFATDELDSDRKLAIENFVKEDAESRGLLEAIRRGIAYSESLRSIDLTEDTIQTLDQSENLVSLSKRLARWSEWPDSLRWSIIAVAVSMCTAALVVAIPWKSIPVFKSGPSFDSSSIEIARIEPRRPRSDDATVAQDSSDDSKENETGPLEGSGDEEFSDDAGAPVSVAVAPPPVATPVATWKPVVPAKRVETAAVAPVAPPVVAAVKPPVPTPVAPAKPVPVAAVAAPAVPSSVPKSSRSFVYRAFMTLSDLEDIAPKITQQIKELGAEKAGEVELGWRRGSGRYYHFTIPEASEQKLLENLRVYGPVRISKDPHPRVMPEGQVRFILWIESGT